MKLRLNCDLAEQDQLTEGSPEHSVMPFIHQANICCGVHAGNLKVMKETAILAKANDVEIGAHPSYPDRENFGRKSLHISEKNLSDSLTSQIQNLQDICNDLEVELAYIKPHGALYNDMMKDSKIRKIIMKVVRANNKPRKLMVMASNQQHLIAEEASRFGINLIFEAFADRCYTDQGLLVNRDKMHAVHSREKTIKQVHQLINHQSITTETGKTLSLNVDSVCVHGDNEAGVSIIKDIQKLILSA